MEITYHWVYFSFYLLLDSGYLFLAYRESKFINFRDVLVDESGRTKQNLEDGPWS